MRKLKTLPASHLERLVRENKPVYVINSSALPSGDKGMVIVNFFDGNRREFFKMPPTFIPMAITDSITPESLLKSNDFRQCLLKGMLTLIEPTSAEAFLSTSEAQEEYESLVLSEHSAKAQNLDINRRTKRTAVHHSSNEGYGPVQDVSAVDTVSNKVRGLIESLIAGSLNSKEVLTQLRRHQSALNAVDFSYVIANTSDQELKKWAKAGLSRTSVEDEEDEYDSGYDEEDEEEESTVTRPRGRPKKAAMAEEKKAEKKSVKKEKTDYANIFDFKNDQEGMTEEEKRADERARAQAMANQAIGGKTMYDKEINKILSGQID